MTVFTCNDDFESIMTCIYDAWASKRGHDNVKLLKGPVVQPDLFCEYIHVEPDAHKTEMVVRSIRNKISEEAYVHIFYASLSNALDALDTIYRFSFVSCYISIITMSNPVIKLCIKKRRHSISSSTHLSAYSSAHQYTHMKMTSLLSFHPILQRMRLHFLCCSCSLPAYKCH